MNTVIVILTILLLVELVLLIAFAREYRKRCAENDVLRSACDQFRSKKFVKSYYKRKGWMDGRKKI